MRILKDRDIHRHGRTRQSYDPRYKWAPGPHGERFQGYATMIKVHCIAQEYWHIREQKCECGGEFESWLQAVAFRKGTDVDVHNTTCKKCGMPREFVFDISSFYNPFRSFSDLAKVERVLKEVYPEGEVAMRMASPMEATLMYVDQLAASADRTALQYIEDAVVHAMAEKNK